MSENDQIERWRTMRAKGPVVFIGVYGVLWGVFMFAVMCLAQFIIAKFFPGKEIEDFFLPVNLAVYGGIFLAVGVLWSVAHWVINERKFKKNNG